MTFEAESADVSVATVEVDGSIVTVGGIAHGVTTVTVTAVDHRRLRVSQGFEVSVGRQVSFASAEVSAPEGGTATLTVVISRPRDVATSLDYVVSPDDDPATADADADDHDGAGGTVVIAARAMEATIALAVHDDTDIEPPRETFAVTLQATEAQLQDFGLGIATVRVTIDEGVCDRTRQVRNALRRSLPCARVSESDLAGVRTLDLSNAGLAALRSADFSGLRNLRALDMSGNSLASLPDGVFAGLGALAEVRLQDNPGSPFTLRVELARTDGPASAPSPARLATRVRQGAPFPMRSGLKAVGGALSSDTSVVTTGMTESGPVSVVRGHRRRDSSGVGLDAIGAGHALREVRPLLVLSRIRDGDRRPAGPVQGTARSRGIRAGDRPRRRERLDAHSAVGAVRRGGRPSATLRGALQRSRTCRGGGARGRADRGLGRRRTRRHGDDHRDRHRRRRAVGDADVRGDAGVDAAGLPARLAPGAHRGDRRIARPQRFGPPPSTEAAFHRLFVPED